MLDSVCDGEDNLDASWNLSTKLKNILYEIPCVNTVRKIFLGLRINENIIPVLLLRALSLNLNGSSPLLGFTCDNLACKSRVKVYLDQVKNRS